MQVLEPSKVVNLGVDYDPLNRVTMNVWLISVYKRLILTRSPSLLCFVTSSRVSFWCCLAVAIDLSGGLKRERERRPGLLYGASLHHLPREPGRQSRACDIRIAEYSYSPHFGLLGAPTHRRLNTDPLLSPPVLSPSEVLFRCPAVTSPLQIWEVSCQAPSRYLLRAQRTLARCPNQPLSSRVEGRSVRVLASRARRSRPREHSWRVVNAFLGGLGMAACVTSMGSYLECLVGGRSVYKVLGPDIMRLLQTKRRENRTAPTLIPKRSEIPNSVSSGRM